MFDELFEIEGHEPGAAYLEDIIYASAEAIRPSEALTVSQAAERYRYINQPGSFVGQWSNKTTPYLVEPMDELTNRLYESVIFVGPAQCGKTDMFLNYLTYTVMCDPADLSLIQTVQGTARDFSMTRVDRLHTQTSVVGDRCIVDNVFDKQYRSGMVLRMQWPTVNELAGKPIPRLWLTDYDRMDMNVGGEGTPFALAKARMTSFKSYGKIAAESSPSMPILNPQWAKTTPHEAPPCEGILSLYNAGDRRRYYWRCISCQRAFEPHWSLISYPKTEDPIEAGEAAVMGCPHCGQIYTHDEDKYNPGKHGMNQLFTEGGHARWIKEGMFWLPGDKELSGRPRRSASASFWLMGVAAAFNNWKQLVTDYLSAEKEYEETFKEDTLKTVVNTKIGDAYLPKAQANARIADALKSRAKNFGMRVVPYGVRFLVATIDVQKNRFEVQVTGVGIDDFWVIDRFPIKFSKRMDENNSSQFDRINPGAHPEDWRHIVYEVMQKTYPLQDDPDRHMAVYYTFCDSAGGEGFTANAYEFWRWLRHGYDNGTPEHIKQLYPWKPGFHARFLLTKGEPTPSAPRVRLGFPDAQRKDRHAGARGEVPVLFLNTNILKNWLDNILDRTEPGGRVNFPDWLPMTYYKELTVEIKNKEGKWENPSGHRNESWDLLVYLLAGLLHHGIGWEHIVWDDPPIWAAEWESNSMVFSLSGATPFDEQTDTLSDLEALGEEMNS